MGNDWLVSLMVIAAAAIVVALVFLLWRRRDHQREENLADYCKQRGCLYQTEHLPLGVRNHFQGDGWQVVSEQIHHQNTAETGSSGVSRSTVWASDEPVGVQFVLGYAPSAGSIGKLPEWMRQTVLAKVSQEFGIAIAPDEPYHALSISGDQYLLIAMDLPASLIRIKALEPLLVPVAKAGHALIRCGSNGCRMELHDCFIRDAETLDALVALGQAF